MNTIRRNKVSDYLEQHKQEYLKQNGDSSGIRGMFYTPDNICELIDAIARIYKPKTVIDICCGTGNLLSYFRDLKVVKGIDINPEVISLAQKIIPNIDFVQADTLEYDFDNQTYDLVLGSLPFGIRLPSKETIEEVLIIKGLDLLSENGLAIFIVPDGLLSRSAYTKLRDHLINNYALDILVSLPDNIFYPYARVKTSILVIRKNKPNREIFMPSFDGQISKFVSDFQSRQGEFYLDVSKINNRLDKNLRLDRNFYLSLRSIEKKLANYETIKLSEFTQIIRGELFSPYDVSASGNYLIFSRNSKAESKFVNSIKNNDCILRDNDIIVGLLRGLEDSISIYKKNTSFDVVISRNFAVIRQSQDVEKYLYLLTYLQTEEGKLFFEEVKSSLMGTSIELARQQLSDIPIPLIPAEELNQLISQENNKIKNNIERYFEFLKQEAYTNARSLVEEEFTWYSEEEKEIYINFVAKEREIKDKNRELEAKEKELEDMMSMFAHKFRSPLDAIVYNTNHGNNSKVYLEAAQTMRGLLDIFSIISTDDKLLKEKLKNDTQGKGRLIDVLNSTLKMALLHLLSVSTVDKIRQHYMSYAIKHGKVDNQITPKIWYEDYDELESSLQLEWEESFSKLISQPFDLDDQLKWIEQHFFKLEVIGFERDDIQFKEYGITESFLVILLNEIVINAFKYYASDTKGSVILQWVDNGDYQIIECHNPSTRSERTRSKGSGKGHTFLSALARKTNSHFTKPVYQDNFVISFGIHNQLLKNKK